MRWVVRGPNIILKQRQPSGFSPLYCHHKWILHTHFLWSICITVLMELHEFIIRCCGLVRHRMTLGYLGAHLICQYYAMFLALTCLLILPVDLQSLLYMGWCAQCCLRVFVVTVIVDDADTNQKDFSFIFSTCAVFVHPQIRHCSALLKWGAIAKVVEEVFWFSHSMTSSRTGLSLARRRESN